MEIKREQVVLIHVRLQMSNLWMQCNIAKGKREGKKEKETARKRKRFIYMTLHTPHSKTPPTPNPYNKHTPSHPIPPTYTTKKKCSRRRGKNARERGGGKMRFREHVGMIMYGKCECDWDCGLCVIIIVGGQ